MNDFFIYYVLSKQKFKKVQQKQLYNNNPDWGQFDPNAWRTLTTGHINTHVNIFTGGECYCFGKPVTTSV